MRLTALVMSSSLLAALATASATADDVRRDRRDIREGRRELCRDRRK
jgi:hypothetical protein